MIKRLKRAWNTLAPLPLGKWLFSRMLGFMIPYTGSISPYVVEVSAGRAQVRIHDKRNVRNHLRSFHALALANLGEVTTGLALHFALHDEGRAILVKLETEYIKKARGIVTALATCSPSVSPFKGVHVVEAQLFDNKQELVALTRASWLIEH